LAKNLPQAKRGLAWLAANQNVEEGKWPAWSVNLKRDPNSYIGHFMNDAATGFAVLALENGHLDNSARRRPRMNLQTVSPPPRLVP
jgi:hypothetical protein